MRPADAAALLLVMAAHSGFAQAPGNFPLDRPPLPGALNQIPVPMPANLSQFVVDTNSAIVLGKAFFWDQQAGSDAEGEAQHIEGGEAFIFQEIAEGGFEIVYKHGREFRSGDR